MTPLPRTCVPRSRAPPTCAATSRQATPRSSLHTRAAVNCCRAALSFARDAAAVSASALALARAPPDLRPALLSSPNDSLDDPGDSAACVPLPEWDRRRAGLGAWSDAGAGAGRGGGLRVGMEDWECQEGEGAWEGRSGKTVGPLQDTIWVQKARSSDRKCHV